MDEANRYGLKEIHKRLLDALDMFSEICDSDHIKYSLHGGTLLGAERDGKLIPWDDDIDVSMTRPEYEKLVKAMRGGRGTCYLEWNISWVPHFVKEDSDGIVAIDIFIWDYISEKRLVQFIKINLLRMIQGMMKRNIDYTRYGSMGKMLIFVTNRLGMLFSSETKQKLYQFVGTRNFLGKKEYIHRYNDSYRGTSYIFDKDYMSEYQGIELEGRTYMVNKRYREFLRMEYGPDYLRLPPENERRPGHEKTRQMLEMG